MKYMVFMIIGVLAASTSAYAQTTAETIDRALAAAPNFMGARDRTAVIAWNDDQTYETLKEGTTNIACFDRSGEPGRPAFAVQCVSVGNLDRVAQTRGFRAANVDDDEGLNAMIAAAEADGTRVLPQYGGVFIAMNGDDQASANKHSTIAVPGASGESVGLPENPGEGGAWVMAAGTTAAHIMLPGS